MQHDQQRDVLGAADEEFHGAKVAGIQRMGLLATGDGKHPFPPAFRKGLDDRVPEDVGAWYPCRR